MKLLKKGAKGCHFKDFNLVILLFLEKQCQTHYRIAVLIHLWRRALLYTTYHCFYAPPGEHAKCPRIKDAQFWQAHQRAPVGLIL